MRSNGIIANVRGGKMASASYKNAKKSHQEKEPS